MRSRSEVTNNRIVTSKDGQMGHGPESLVILRGFCGGSNLCICEGGSAHGFIIHCKTPPILNGERTAPQGSVHGTLPAFGAALWSSEGPMNNVAKVNAEERSEPIVSYIEF